MWRKWWKKLCCWRGILEKLRAEFGCWRRHPEKNPCWGGRLDNMLNGAVNIKKIVPPSRREKVFRAAACLAPNGSQPAWPPDSVNSKNYEGRNYEVEFAWIAGSNTPSLSIGTLFNRSCARTTSKSTYETSWNCWVAQNPRNTSESVEHLRIRGTPQALPAGILFNRSRAPKNRDPANY